MTRRHLVRILRALAVAALPAGLLAAAVAVPAPVAAQPPAAPIALAPLVQTSEQDRIAVIEKVSPAVVAVNMLNGKGCGSGVIIDPEGYALTNHHVISAPGMAPGVMRCGLADGVFYDAVLVGYDFLGDVALIKLLPKEPGKPFPFVQLGNSDEVRLGEYAFAAGNPFSVALDFTPTVTFGIVSGTNRYEPLGSRPGGQEYTDCIQVDVPINPGNSGGPLFNMRGQLIGINGRISLEKRGRVNVGVGYAISINQIKNFLVHLYAGIATDHATLGALVLTENEDADLARMVVRQILDDADAYRRGLRAGDQLTNFAGRNMSSTNHYKNILGTFPAGWRVPITYRRENESREILVRLQTATPAEKSERPADPKQPRPMPVGGPAPKVETPASKLYKPGGKGLANAYFNDLARDKLLAAAKKHGDFAAAQGSWVADGTYEADQRKGDMRLEIAPGGGDDARVTLKLNIEHKLQPLKQTDLREQAEPIGSGGLMMALYHYRRFLTAGPKGFEGEFLHGGGEPFYPPPADGATPKSLAALRVDADVMRTRHGPVTCKWYHSRADARLMGFEAYLSKDADPCEVYLSDYRDAGAGRQLPHRVECRFADKRYAVLTVTRWALQ
ncbi:S1C family serine protease [Urbifossiella limnaea]|uniref:Periplasmic serine endoprotease DegP n=1 Tax=Urbifossiella limnaea TaxID=2528023 RepID=A0A517XXS2_9BACT|nr:trypsin-like peptidase domain-containing protein [Urbifossiella limnaea]QDU22320.1 Periplasmic serine endoprotease DegP precursor [Urbifossiella limnaea]